MIQRLRPRRLPIYLVSLVGEVGADPTTPEATVLQTAAFADSLLSQINDHQSLFTLVPCYLVVWVGDLFEFLSPLESLKLYEGVARSTGIEPISDGP